MGDMSLKERAVVAFLTVLAAYAFAVAAWFFYSEVAWAKSARMYKKAVDKYREEKVLIFQKDRWAEAYKEEKARMPAFEFGEATDTKWISKLCTIAEKNHIVISNLQGGKEIKAGDVLELPIEVKNWEGSLEALVKFMYELENTEEGMFDIKQINIKPSNKKGYLKGSFVLTCAYMRED